MPDYSKACIYIIKKQDDFNNDNVYIGSCCNFIKRKYDHKNSCNNKNSQNYNFKLYKHIRENGDWNSWCMTKIIDYPCNSKSELITMERSYIDNYKSKLNCNIPSRTKDEWYNDNKDKMKQYRVDNKEKIMEYKKQYWIDNKDKIKQYRVDNKEKIMEYKKQYHVDNKDKIEERRKQKVNCDKCGCEVRKDSLIRHKKSQKCINFK